MKSFKEQTAGMPLGKKIGYVWTYYKAAVIAIVVAVIIIIYAFYRIAQDPIDELFSLVATDMDEDVLLDSTYQEDFMNAYGYSTEDQEISMEGSFDIDVEAADTESSSAYQILSAMILSGDVDLILCEEDLMEMLVENNGLTDLTEYIGEEELAEKFSTDTGSEACYGIEIPKSSFVYEEEWYSSDMTIYACLAGSGDNLDVAVQFIEFMFE